MHYRVSIGTPSITFNKYLMIIVFDDLTFTLSYPSIHSIGEGNCQQQI